jgi:hypothetical protein
MQFVGRWIIEKRRHIRFPTAKRLEQPVGRGAAEDATSPKGSSGMWPTLWQRGPGPDETGGGGGKRSEGLDQAIRRWSESGCGRANSTDKEEGTGLDSPPGKQRAGTRPCFERRQRIRRAAAKRKKEIERVKEKAAARRKKAEASNRKVKGSREK